MKEIKLEELRELTVRIYKGEELLFHTEGFNEALLSGVMLFQNEEEKEGRDYRLEMKFNLEEWPECTYPNDQNSGIMWQLKIFSTDNILLLEDTREKQFFDDIMNQWEEKEPGRKEKAKRSRDRYLLLKKKELGEELTEEEQAFLAEFQERTRKNKEDQGQDKKKGGQKKAGQKKKQGKQKKLMKG